MCWPTSFEESNYQPTLPILDITPYLCPAKDAAPILGFVRESNTSSDATRDIASLPGIVEDANLCPCLSEAITLPTVLHLSNRSPFLDEEIALPLAWMRSLL